VRTRLRVMPTPTFGAVVDVDLRRLDERAFSELRAAWLEHPVLVFPGQGLTDEEQIAFSLRFGRLERLGTKERAAAGKEARIGGLSNLGPDGRPVPVGSSLHLFLAGNQAWHSDSSFKPVAAKASVLSARAVPSVGGETEWADMRAAYDALPPERRERLAGLRAVHSYWYSQSRVGGTDVLSPEDWAALPPVEHPVVRVHEETGRRSLFVGRHASHVVGMEEEAGRRLLEELLEDAVRPERRLAHRWAVGDVVLWDNRCVLHRGRPWPPGEARVMKRTTIAGDGDNDWALADRPAARPRGTRRQKGLQDARRGNTGEGGGASGPRGPAERSSFG
jgi:alpha-ketoglutarate-dependent 2,4-dichlorophenoxyacetate dioxygenase